MTNNTIVAVDPTGSYRLYLAVTTDLVEEAKTIHGASNLAAAALGRVLTAAGIMGLMLKEEDFKLTLQIKGDGPAAEILASADGRGRVKGYIADPDVQLPLKAGGKLDVGGAVGQGTLTVIKDLQLKEPYLGRVELVSGEIAEDLASYFLLSEQQPSTVALGVLMSEDNRTLAAGGLVVQALPGAREDCLAALEESLAAMGNLTDHLREGQGPRQALEDIFGDLPAAYEPQILEEGRIRWVCDCSRGRMEQALLSIGEEDLKELIREDKGAELTCQFCLKQYAFNEGELLTLLVEGRESRETPGKEELV